MNLVLRVCCTLWSITAAAQWFVMFHLVKEYWQAESHTQNRTFVTVRISLTFLNHTDALLILLST